MSEPAKPALSADDLAPETILRRLEWKVLRRLDGLLHGDYRTLFRGFGLDLADLREYQYNDDVRHIDWNVTARMGHPFTKKFVEERVKTDAQFAKDVLQAVGENLPPEIKAAAEKTILQSSEEKISGKE